MSFLNTFIEISLLEESEVHTAQLNHQNRLLNEQNILLHQQNEGINALIRHNQQQDWIRDYIYRINKLCDVLEQRKDKNSMDYYYAIYCVAKSVSDSGITTSVISEVGDKEYFDKCVNKIENLLFNFIQNNKEKINGYNYHIKAIEEESILLNLKACEVRESRFNEISRIVNKYETRKEISNGGLFLGFIPFIIFVCFYFTRQTISDSYNLLLIFLIGIVVSLILGAIFKNLIAKTRIKKGDAPLTKEQYEELKKEKHAYQEQQSNDQAFYEYAKSMFTYLNFENNKDSSLTEQIDSILEKKNEDIKNAHDAFTNSYVEIFNTFYLSE